ncbi:MAG TPA: helix-turn-helix domain-containing protein [Candidatus Binatia bacterium]|jgi:DNA-binding HxlR family transcriptional regulator|nr:helix-turn-helix domain-containing protein [Candidatus Binatia bacterium]
MATTTATQRRQQAKQAYDAFMAECPTRQLLESLNDKWTGLLLCALGEGTKRHSELARRIAGVSQKMLTQTLRTLERDGLITRTVTPSVPVRVDYALTPLGRDLLPVMVAIKDWAEHNMDDVNTARRRYDARADRARG